MINSSRVLLSLAFVALFAGLTSAQRNGRVSVVQADKIYVGNGQIIEDGIIVIDNKGKIAAIGPGSSIEIPRGARRLRTRGAISPGLIDAAAASVLGSGKDDQSSEVTPDSRVLAGVDLGNKLLGRLAREGVTTVFVSPGNSAVISGLGGVIKTGRNFDLSRVLQEESSPKMVLISGPERGNARPRSPQLITQFTRLPLGKMGGVFVARSAFAEARRWNAARKAGARVQPNEAFDVLGKIMAKKMPMRVLAHRQNQVATAGRLAREFGFDYVIVEGVESYRNLDQLARDKASVIYGPVKRPARVNVPAAMRRFFSDPYVHHKASTATKLTRRGIPTAITARGATGEAGLARQAMMAMRYGLSRDEALRAVTSIPAKMLGIDDRVGTLEVGKDADLILWSGEPFDPTSRQREVILGGRRVKGETF